ncbi:iron-sulfur cluster biosynthesis family protein [Pediococcus ethanolidurans]|uniref:iron-sulfur cluster biosynthesis family protein n=1 Tax=Pediococcus ethanolidurans TaxID=319653 RepID=UPI0021AA6A84|nr:iron-sulfur cluster biosynthesis family protein [Pediococcus ethanolidurans]MCT4397611.1 iron-sulfur cluster biosynthesis family protein [Pediococcus ethanolidurans]
MLNIKVTDSVMALLKRKNIADKTLLLVTDDGGGKYSLQGGACSIGAKFSIVALDEFDPEYPLSIENNFDLKLYTSDYDTRFLRTGLTLDVKNSRITLKDNTGLLDSNVLIANGKDILAAFEKGIIMNGESC